MSVLIAEKCGEEISKLLRKVGQITTNKLQIVLEKHVGFQVPKSVISVLNRKSAKINKSVSPESNTNLKHALIISIDVKRNFSVYKNILSDRRLNFSPEKHLIIN